MNRSRIIIIVTMMIIDPHDVRHDLPDSTCISLMKPLLGSPNPRNEWITPEIVAKLRSSANFGGWFFLKILEDFSSWDLLSICTATNWSSPPFRIYVCLSSVPNFRFYSETGMTGQCFLAVLLFDMDLLSQTITPKYPIPLSQQYYSILFLSTTPILIELETTTRLHLGRRYSHHFLHWKTRRDMNFPLAPLLEPLGGQPLRFSQDPEGREETLRDQAHRGGDVANPWRTFLEEAFQVRVGGRDWACLFMVTFLCVCIYIYMQSNLISSLIIIYIISYILHIQTSNIKMILAYITWYIMYIT